MNLNLELLENDVNYGLLKEEEIRQTIKRFFNLDQFLKLSQFHTMDFKSHNKYFEIKSRRFSHNKYKTTMIGKNKVDYAQTNKDNTFYFIFVFDDGIYYYKYNTDDKLELNIGGRCDRGGDEYKLYYYIPINFLVKIL